MRRIATTFVIGILIANASLAQRIPDRMASDFRVATTGGIEDPAAALPAVAAGQALYGIGSGNGAGGGSILYRIDSYGNGPYAQDIAATNESLFDLGIDPTTGRFYGVGFGGGGTLFELNPATGQATLIGSTGADLSALEFDVSGQAWGWGGGSLYRVDKNLGAATFVGATGFQVGGDLAFDSGGVLYGTTNSELIRIDTTTGVGTLVGSLGFTGAFGLEADTDGTLYAGRGNSSPLPELYRVDKSNGAATFIGSVLGAENYGLAGLAFAPAASAPALLLRNGRFKVEATWRLVDGTTGDAIPVQLTTDTGYFWFFAASNVEFVIKVLGGCGLNNRYWVFAGGLTNVAVDVQVTDTLTGTIKSYSNPLSQPFQPIQDTSAFSTCP